MTEIVAFPNENGSNVDARGLKRQSSVSGMDPLKKSKVEDNVIILEDGSPSTSSGYVTPLPLAPTSAVNSVKRLTPKLSKEEREAERIRKALQKRLREEERERAKAEKEKIAEEKRLEKERKEKEREEKRKEDEKKKEEKRREEEERKERKRREEEEKQKKKEELAQKKREEEERREAKRKEEEERKEAIEEKKRRASARFIGFFSKLEKKKPEVADKTEYELWYKPFEVKDGMKLAPIQRRHVLHLDDDILKQEEDASPNDYLLALSKNPRKLVGVTANPMRAKLYQFHDNYRPPYYGTWRIRSKVITGRRPFTTKDENIDYEVDSDAEWEDEPSDAEECKSDEEDDAGGDSDVDSDHDAFFVEPGYLSAGEGDEASDDDAPADAKDAEERRERLAARAREWKSRVLGHRQPGVLVPRCVGPLYCSAAAPHTLAALRAVLF